MGQFDNKVALVTGGTKGIGLAIAKLFLKEGAKGVAFTGRHEDEGKAVQERFGERSLFITQDVSKEEDWQNATKAVVDKFGQLDAIVNNAGIGTPLGIEEMTLDHWNREIAIDLTNIGRKSRDFSHGMDRLLLTSFRAFFYFIVLLIIDILLNDLLAHIP
ncbi:SDR family NAD(P)-dependent oxidoreductase [Limosilactobacillus fermentum]|uniref:SDR family NAD(P)-dependent oxidoreductase n=1 Tax=Limosilactobacillus fermentum TaxID=1613 RepID=UPI003B676828